MTYHDKEGHRHYVGFVGDHVGFTQVCKMKSLTNVSSLFDRNVFYVLAFLRGGPWVSGTCPSGGICTSGGF